MKTLTYLPTLLALTIQAMVSGQTPANQTHKIRVNIMGAKQPVKMNYANSNITISIEEYNQLLEQANILKINAQKLKEEAVNNEEQSLIKQIEASELSAKITYQKFEQNKKVIFDLFNTTPKNNYRYIKAQVSNSEAEYFIKIAKEMREEANSQLTIQAKYGDMTNAEEKELLALNKQKEVLDLFRNIQPQALQNIETMVSQQSVTKIREKQSVAIDVAISTSQENTSSLYDALKQADDLKLTAQQLRTSAVNALPNEKSVLINEAINLENEYVLKQIEVSVINAILTYEKFYKNRTVIELLIKNIQGNDELVSKATQLNTEAERLLKIGKEIREEANAQLTNAAKYGAMSNASETESFAIGKQHESIQIIEKQNIKLNIASR